MDSHERSSCISQFVAMTVMITSTVLYIWAVPVSNNFELSRFFLYETLVPALVLSIIVGIACRVFKQFLPAIAFGLMAASMISTLWVVISLSSFVSTNSSNFMVVYGQIVIHQNLIYSIMHGLQLSSMIATTSWMAKVHQKYKEDGRVTVFHHAAVLTGAAGTSALLLFLSVYIGSSYILLGYMPILGIGITSIALSFIRSGEQQPITDRGLDDVVLRRRFFGSRLVSTILVVLVLAFSSILLPVQRFVLDFTADFGERTSVIAMERTLVLDKFILILLWVSIFSSIILVLSRFTWRFKKMERSTTLLSTSLLGGVMVVIGLGYLGMGSNPGMFPVHPSGLMFAAVVACTYALFTLIHNRLSNYGWAGGIIGFSWIMGTLLIIIGLEGDTTLDYELLGGISVLAILALGVLAIILRVVFHVIYNKESFIKKARKGPLQIRWVLAFNEKKEALVQRGKNIPSKKARYLVLGLIIGCIAVSGTTTALGVSSIQAGRERQIISLMDGDGIIWVAHANDRIDPQFMPTVKGTNVDPVVELSGAGNEIEPLQLVLRGTGMSTMQVYSVRLSNMTNLDNLAAPMMYGWNTNENGTSSPVYWLEPMPELEDKWYDPIMPFNQKPVRSDENAVLWILFNITTGQPAGTYNGTLTLELTGSNGVNREVELTIRLRIYGFSLPKYPTVSSYFGHMTSDDQMQYLTGHKLMKDCWIAPDIISWNGNGTVDLNFTPFNESIVYYLNKSFSRFIMHYPGSHEARGGMYSANWNATEVDYWTQVQEVAGNYTIPELNATVLDLLYTYGYDEVGNAVGTPDPTVHVLESAYARYKFMKDNGIKIRIMQTIHKPETYVVREPGDVSVAQMLEVVDIWCIHPKVFSNTPVERPQFMADLHQYMNDQPSRNVTIWTYTTSGPRFPMPTLTLLGTGTTNRALFWECFIHDYEGYLVWSASYWGHDAGGFAYGGFGGGAIIYPHEDGFVGTHRGEMMREGVEDYEYFHLLELKANDTAGVQLLARVDQLYPVTGDLSFDNAAFSSLRHEIGLYIESHP